MFIVLLHLCSPRLSEKINIPQAEDGIRDAQESRGLGDVYKRQVMTYSRAKVQGQRSAGSEDRVEINRRTDRWRQLHYLRS